MLVLKSVRQFMRHHWLLTIKVDPVCKEKLLLLRVVVARDLLREQFDDERSKLKILWNETEFFQ